VRHFPDHLVEGSGIGSIFVDVRRVEEILSGALKVVLGAERIEKTGRGTEVGDASRDGNTSAGDDNDLLALVQDIQDDGIV